MKVLPSILTFTRTDNVSTLAFSFFCYGSQVILCLIFAVISFFFICLSFFLALVYLICCTTFFSCFDHFTSRSKVQSTTLNNEIILHFLKTILREEGCITWWQAFSNISFFWKTRPQLLTSLLSNPVIVAPRLWRTFNFKTRSWRRMVNMTIHLSASPSNTDSCGFISLRIMCIEELKLKVKVRPSATVRRAVSFKLFREPWELRMK